MYTLCCTIKLRKRAKLPADPPAPPTTALGNWYGNLLYIERRQFLLFVSERSRLAVVTPARKSHALAGHLRQHLAILLAQLHAEKAWIDAELAQMDEVTFSATHNRSILGTMNDYREYIKARLLHGAVEREMDFAFELSDMPVGALDYQSPGEVTLPLLEEAYAAG